MKTDELFLLRVKDAEDKVSDLKQRLEDAKEKAFAAHDSMLRCENNDRSNYESACLQRESLRDELINAESELNNLIARKAAHDFSKHENEMRGGGIHSRNILNLAMIIFGLCAGLIIAKLF